MKLICVDVFFPNAIKQGKYKEMMTNPQRLITDPEGYIHAVTTRIHLVDVGLRIHRDIEDLRIGFGEHVNLRFNDTNGPYKKQLKKLWRHLKWKVAGFKFTQEYLDELRNSLSERENVLILGNDHADKVVDDLVYSNGFVRIFVLPPGRHYFKIMGDDIEYLTKEQ